jgi:transcriptional regulator with XRE-family HTH domain
MRDKAITDEEACRIVAGNVSRLLDEHKLSRRDVAKITGDSTATIARLAAGSHNAGLGVVMRVASALGVTVGALFKPVAATIKTGRARSRTKPQRSTLKWVKGSGAR